MMGTEARCDGCNRIISPNEPVVQAAVQYNFCAWCVEVIEPAPQLVLELSLN